MAASACQSHLQYDMIHCHGQHSEYKHRNSLVQ